MIPVTDFSADIVSWNEPLVVQFTDLSTNTPTSRERNFHDGSPLDTTQNPEHTYAMAGVYNTTLKATNVDWDDTELKLGYITVNEVAPVAEFSATPLTGDESLSVQFTDESTHNPDTWDRDFGDGTTHDTTQNPLHIYTEEGSYDVVLTVTNSTWSDDETKVAYVVVDPIEETPSADFIANHLTWEAPIAIQFTDQSNGIADTRYWDFGDGNFSDEQNPLHTYYKEWTYSVSLYINNDLGEDTELKTNYLTFTELTPGQDNVINEEEWRRWDRSFPPEQEWEVDRPKKIDYADAGDRSIPDVYA